MKRIHPDCEPCEPRALLAVGLLVARIDPNQDLDGNGLITADLARIVGRTDPGATVRIDVDGRGEVDRTVFADDLGHFRARVEVPLGLSRVQIRAQDAEGGVTGLRLAVTRTDPVIAFNDTALDAIRAGKTGPPQASRHLAMLHLAMDDAVNAVTGAHDPYLREFRAPEGASAEAAATQAAAQVLTALYPDQAEAIERTRLEAMTTVGPGAARVAGRILGGRVGRAMLAARVDDGATASVAYPPGDAPGYWVPTPPGFAKPAVPQWRDMRGFVVADPAEFLATPPPALDSPEYAAAVAEVQLVGGKTSSARTEEQTAIARFWADLPAVSFTPPGHWNQIAQNAVIREGLDLTESARLFARMNAAQADAGICSWDSKYEYNLWRPVTAIRQADRDGNPATTADPSWEPLLVTPAFPAYTSGHSTFSAAAAAVLEDQFGADYQFTDVGDPALGLAPRRFDSFRAAAQEAGQSRIYGGIHYPFDNRAGLDVGWRIGRLAARALGD